MKITITSLKLDRLVVFLQNIITLRLCIIFKCKKNRPHAVLLT